VLEVKTGKVIFSMPIEKIYAWSDPDRPMDWPAKDWPGHEWGIQFTVMMKGLDGRYLP
jgi:hypothetical protein